MTTITEAVWAAHLLLDLSTPFDIVNPDILFSSLSEMDISKCFLGLNHLTRTLFYHSKAKTNILIPFPLYRGAPRLNAGTPCNIHYILGSSYVLVSLHISLLYRQQTATPLIPMR